MKNVYIITFIFLVTCSISCSKNEPLKHNTMPNFGLIADDPRKVEKVKLKISSQYLNSNREKFTDREVFQADILAAPLPPASFLLAAPPVGNQGGEGSCSSFSSVRYARSIEQYYETGASSYSDNVNIFSVEFVYNQVKAGASCQAGSSMTSNLDFMYNAGVCKEITMPYNDTDCSTLPNNTQQTEAANYKISNYARLVNSDIAGIKSVLMQGHAIMISINPDNGFVAADANYIWNFSTATDGTGAHAVTVVGWDDSKNAYKIINQWGTSWGDNGYSWIDYDYFATGGKVGYYVYYITGLAISNTAPTANAGFDQNIPSGQNVILDGTASSDPDGTIIGWLWTQVSGPATPTIVNSTSAVASVTPTVAGTYIFKLTVTDNSSNTASDTVTINVTTAVVETIVISVLRKTTKGKVVFVISWNISLANNPISAAIEISAYQDTGFNTIYPIVPYLPQGTYTYQPTSKSPSRYWYFRIKVVKFTGEIVYSNTVGVKT